MVSALIPEALFLKFMHLTTEGLKFSFDENMYTQIDGVSMGNPLNPVRANIFFFFWLLLEVSFL